MANKEVCKLCGLGRPEHKRDDINHLFDLDGKLRAKKKQPKQDNQPPPGHRVAPQDAVSARLAVLLNNKGVINPNELTWILTGTGSPPFN